MPPEDAPRPTKWCERCGRNMGFIKAVLCAWCIRTEKEKERKDEN